MSDATRIDTLSIEIETHSNNAIDNLEEIAIALEDIKAQGKIGTAVKNLEGLAKAIKDIAIARSPSQNLTALKQGMEGIHKVGSITTITNRIDKLVGTMGGVAAVDLTGAKEKFDRIKDSLSGLSNLKSGGIGTMVNALAKIDKVTASLGAVDENGVDAIDRFAEKVAKLNEKLTPLSDKMVTIQAGLKGVTSKARSAGTGVKEFGSKLNVTSVNVAAFSTVLRWAQGILRRFQGEIVETMATAIEWDGIAARFGRGFGGSAQETYDWIKRLNKEMNINTQDFMQYSSVYATMLTGYGVAQEDAAKMALGYAELTYDIWAGYNDIYKTYEDAAVAVRAAIAGETEPIQKAGLDVRDSALKQVAALNEVEYSTQGATQAQKSYLRYLALVEQAHDQSLVGTYATEMNNAEGAIRTLKQQLKSLAQTLGSVLLPLLVEIVPWVAAFVELLTDATLAVANFFGIEIQPVDFSGYGDNMAGITDPSEEATEAIADTTEALKDLKKATVGIDELNIISPPTGNAGGAGAGINAPNWEGLDVDSLWDENVFNAVSSHIDELKEKLKGLMPVIIGLAVAFSGLRLLEVAFEFSVLSSLLKNTAWAKGIGIAVDNGLMTAFGGTSFAWIKTVVGAKITTALGGVGSWLAAGGGWAIAIIAAVVGAIVLAVVDYDFTEIGRKIGVKIGEVCRTAWDWLAAVGTPILDGLSRALDWCAENITFENILSLLNPYTWSDKIIPWMVEVGVNIVGGIVEGLWEGFLNLLLNVGEFIVGVYEGFCVGFGIHSPAESMKPIGKYIVEGIWEGLSDAWEELKRWWQGLELSQISFKMPHFTWSMKDATGALKTVMDFLSIPAKIPSLSVKWYAQGGFPEAGELFVAREAGPEMVGKMGNRTTVANNEQIVEGISEGVYAAVLAAMRQTEGNGGQAVNVYLDGRQITASVEKRQGERGLTMVNRRAYGY